MIILRKKRRSREMRIDIIDVAGNITQEKVKGKTVIIIDVLRATSVMTTALANGVKAIYIYQSNPVKNLRKQKERKLSFTQDFITAFLLTFSNVLIVLLYIGLFARFGFILPDHSLGMIIGGIICIGIGAISWWLFITYIVSKLRKWFNVRGIWLMNRIVGSTIIILSIIGIISVLLTYYIKIPLI